jgi:nicotinamide-nucleotide amidase
MAAVPTRAAVLSIGSELLRGDILDTNAAFLTRQLSQLGFHVQWVEQVGDELETLTQAVRRAIAAAQVVVCTGGLGPTQDDLTREAIAAAVEETMFSDPDLKIDLEARFAAMRRQIVESNFRQTQRIPSADALPNPNGTAPGWYVRKNGRIIVALPGPPGEMEPMWRDAAEPRLAALLTSATARRALMTFGIGESMLEHRISEIIGRQSDVIVATYAKSSGVEVHVTAHSRSLAEAQALVDDTEREIRRRLGMAVYGVGGETLSSVVGQALQRRGLTLAVMESATGGELASMITDNPGSSVYFLGGIVAYTRPLKEAYGVAAEVIERHGIISREVARAMAAAARRQTGALVGIGVTGVAGTAAVEGKPPGTCFLAVDLEHSPCVREIHRPAHRAVAKRFFAQCALDLLRRTLEGDETPDDTQPARSSRAAAERSNVP